MNKSALLLSALLLTSAANCLAAPVAVSKTVKIETFNTVTPRELWSALKPTLSNSGSVIVQHQGFDVESASIEGDWRACAIILVGTTDLGINPVALRIWTTFECDSSVKALTPDKNSGPARFSIPLGRGQTLQVEVTPDQKVHVNGRILGSIQDVF